jgi:4-diphosphocytidyl-2-C-methyl-D-erythritol kinase
VNRPVRGSVKPAAGPGVGGVVEVSAPAKLTLNLRITGVRPDGYHLLESEMVSLDLADTLQLGPGDDLVVQAEDGSQVAGVPGGPDNLVARALAAVGRRASVRLVKRIPPGAGLGGGSADAAAVLRWAGGVEPGVAVALGADVPFCVTGGRALVTGVGERLAPLEYVPREFVLLLPPFGVNTMAVYRAWDLLHRRGRLPEAGSVVNELEAPAVTVEPRLGYWKDVFAQVSGAAPQLAGSGSTWFVEGTLASLGLSQRRFLTLGPERARLVPVRTTPAVIA